jgi:N-acyl amino acid synthase of PEP-CTERM/exosortase system
VSVISHNFDTLPKQSAVAAHCAQSSLINIYQKYFEYHIVQTAEDRLSAYQLRYDVYCEENDYLSKTENPSGQERDACDAHSVQSILRHIGSNRVAGTVRMVLPLADKPGCGQPARLFSDVLATLPDSVLPHATTGEISRFAIHPSFRRRLGDGLYARIFAGDELAAPDFDPRRIIPHITLGLFASIFEMVRNEKITHLCAVIDPALLRILGRLGLRFHKAGGPVEFHGVRQPVYASGDELLANLLQEQPDIYDLIVSGDGGA